MKLSKASVGFAVAALAVFMAPSAARAGISTAPEATVTGTFVGATTDRVGDGEGATSLSPDTENDRALSLDIAYAGTHTVSNVLIIGSSGFSRWNTYPGDGTWIVGLTAPSTGAAFLNSYDAEASIGFSDTRSLWAYISDDGSLAAENRVFVTVCFDGNFDSCARAEILLDTDGDLDDDGYTPPADCNDNHAAANPGMTEIPDDNFDNDCDGVSLQTYFRDLDGDQYGDPNTTVAAGSQPSGYLSYPQDCDDTNPDIHPYRDDVPDNAVDENCDGKLAQTYYVDGDQDGFGSAATEVRDAPEAGWSTVTGDCNDGDASVHPGSTESSATDGIDQDCDGTVEGATWYTDADDDGWGDLALSQVAVDQPTGTSSSAGDCDDADASVNPGATETPDNTVDEDCDGDISGWVYADNDGDAFGAGSPTVSNDGTAGTGEALVAGDCNDVDSDINPSATEVPDNDVDEDCDSSVDYTFYADADSDGFGDAASSVAAPSAPTGHTSDNTDCDDEDATVFPGAVDIPDDGVDQNCDGLTSAWVYGDADGDGFGTTDTATVSNDGTAGPGRSYVGGDCDDNASSINPSATEVPDNTVDEDCDGLFDSTWYRDADVDGFGDPLVTTIAPSLPTGYTIDSTDCDDANTAAHPGATEIAGNGVDEDCNGADLPVTLAPTTLDPDRSGSYVSVKGSKVTIATTVSSSLQACTTGRIVTFTVNGGLLASPLALTGTSLRSGAASASTTLAPGSYSVGISTPATADCAAATNPPLGFVVASAKPGKIR